MPSKMISLKNTFGDSVRIDPDQFSYFAVWDDSAHINFWNAEGDSCAGTLRFTPDTFAQESDQVFETLKARGMQFLRLPGGINPKTQQEQKHTFYCRPEKIEYFEDDLFAGDPSADQSVALTVAGVHFYLSEEEKADFKHRLKTATPQDDWIEFSKDLGTQFKCASGHYAFRKSMITDMFAVPVKNHLAVQTPDRYRSFVPVENPQDAIDSVAAALPQLQKSDAPASAYPLYFDPAVYPPERRHHVNIIMRR